MRCSTGRRSRPLRSLHGSALFVRSFACLALLHSGGAFAQPLTDTLRLRTFEVTGTRRGTFAVGAKLEVLDSAAMARYATNDLATMLAAESPVFIKSHGLGSLATSSFRGGSASHTAVLWNGFNIGSPMNGQMDLALIPMGVANDVRIQYGAGTALWGSGAVGGTIHLNNVPRFGGGLALNAGVSVGSFNDQRQQLNVTFGHARWAASVSLLQASARNDFPFTNTELPGAPIARLGNAGLQQGTIVAQVHRRLKAGQQVHVGYWYQDSDRGIPPTMHQAISTAKQRDVTHRLTAGWQRTGKRTVLEARGAWFDEDLLWYPFGTDAVMSRSRTAIAEAEATHHLTDRHVLSAGINLTHARAVSDGYPDEPRQDRAAFFLAHRARSRDGRSRHSVSVRQEVMDGTLVPITASAGVEYDLAKRVLLRGSASKVYRIPTFNDLYWVPGGDRDLLPESGYAGEVGIALEHAFKGLRFKGDAAVYSRTLDNWIMWVPGPVFWRPENVMQVWSRGVETRAELKIPLRRTTITASILTNHVVSTNQVPKVPNDASVDRQLIYVPMYAGHGRIAVLHGPFSLTFQLSYTGYRYTSTDNRSYLEPFTLGSAWASYTLKPWKRHTLALDAQANNLFDTVYQTIAYRPMPLRNYRVGLRWYFGKAPAGTTTTP